MNLMKRAALSLFAVLLVSSVASANPIDPTIIVRSGIATGTIVILPGPVIRGGENIHFQNDIRCKGPSLEPDPSNPSNLVPAMACSVINRSGEFLTSLTFAIGQPLPFWTLQNNSFGTWTHNADFTLMTFTFIDPIPFTGDFSEFEIVFIGFDPNNPPTITLTASVPEPATALMLLAGLGLVGFSRRRSLLG